MRGIPRRGSGRVARARAALVLVVCAPALAGGLASPGAQEPGGAPQALARPERAVPWVEAGELRFPRTGTRVALADGERVALSPRAERVALAAPTAAGLAVRVFDALGAELTRFEVDRGYAALHVSDGGRVALAEPVSKPEARRQDLRLFGPDGRERWRDAQRWSPAHVALDFGPGREVLAVLALRVDLPERQLEACVIDDSGPIWSHALAAELSPAALAFGNSSERIAFGAAASPADRGVAGRVVVWEGPGDAPARELELSGLGQPLDAQGLAFCGADRFLAVNGLGRVQLVEIAGGQALWTRHLDRPQAPLDTAARIAWTGELVLAVHRQNAPAGEVRYAVHALDLVGELRLARVLDPPQPRLGHVGRLFELSPDGRSLVFDLRPDPVALALP